jgi:hypothetical protein
MLSEALMHHVLLLVALPFFVVASPAWAVSVTLNPGTEISLLAAIAHADSISQELFNPSLIPFADSSSVAFGGSNNVSTYDLSDSGFEITFDHARARNDTRSSFVTRAQSAGRIHFSLDQDAAYQATGAYAAIDAEGHRMFLDVELFDITSGVEVFRSFQESRATPNEAFVLGGNGGDFDNILSGALSGALMAGHEYRYRYNAIIVAGPEPPPATQSAEAAGFATFALVPEPSTVVLLALGLFGLAARDSVRA